MAQLAIKGHSTRGSEIIALLEMLGGINSYNLYGDESYAYYTIDSDKEIKGSIYVFGDEQLCHFTLEEFEEKFPYKVGDKVITDDGDKASIVGMIWDNDIDDVFYDTQICNEIFKYPKELLQPYKEETMEEKDKAMAPNLVGEDYSGKRFGYKIPQGYEFDCIQNNQIIIKPIKPKYPKTYEECCELTVQWKECDCNPNSEFILCEAPIHDFCKLIVARNIYWKIAGEQMGLEKSWEPEYTEGVVNTYYTIHLFNNKLFLAGTSHRNAILSFPTEEMRDVFYENFKELIEICKELL